DAAALVHVGQPRHQVDAAAHLERGGRRVVLVFEEEAATEQRRQRGPFVERRRVHVLPDDGGRRFNIRARWPVHGLLLPGERGELLRIRAGLFRGVVAMEQKTGVSSLYAEFFQGYGAEIGLFCPEFCPNSTHKPTYTFSSRRLTSAI